MTALIFVLFIVLLVIGMPLPGAIGLSTIYGLDIANLNMNVIWSGMTRTLNSYTLLAIPFFILAGNIMSKGSIAQMLLKLCLAFGGKKKLTMGFITIVTCAFFAALSGSSVATVAAIAPITFPIMRAMGYEKAWAAAIVAAGAIVGPIIPPSVIMVVYGISSNTSISQLFMAGIIPGILLSLSFAIVIKLTNKGKIDLEVNRKNLETIPDYTFKEKMGIAWEAKWALMMPLIVLGGIYLGIFTPTEASIVACDYVILVGLIQRNLPLKELFDATVSMLKTSGGLIIIIACAQAFGYVIALNQIPDKVVAGVSAFASSPIIILLILNVILLFVGCFMEAAAAIVILTPILLPLAELAGLTSLQFGVIMCVNLVIGTLTPPFGLDVFVASSITGEPTYKIFARAVPFMISALAVLMLITYVPAIIDFLPNLMK